MVIEWSVPVRVGRLDDKCKSALESIGYDRWYIPRIRRIGGSDRYLPLKHRTPVVLGFSIAVGR
jgi:hypothetical protein